MSKKSEAFAHARMFYEGVRAVQERTFIASLTARGYTESEIEQALAVTREMFAEDVERELASMARRIDDPDAASVALH